MHNAIYNSETVKPTYLCIKIHSITGLRYFCKTTRDPEKYKGSGLYWQLHIKKHGKEHVRNELILGPYPNKSELTALALYMSVELDIVNSNEWANLIPENGISGGSIKGRITTGNNAKDVPKTGGAARGILKGPATGRNARGTVRGPQPILTCPHCGKSGGISAMKRHHFDNCKMKPI